MIYPRIVTGSQYPLLDEGNCPELKFIVEKAKALRDAIVHASTAKRDQDDEFDKERSAMTLDYPTVEEIVDSSVMLVRKIQTKTSLVPLRWLFDRGEDGFFPETTFE